ncbi:Uma2 family endonuclease [Bacillaceae bacterium Marseille-Q3522]|nr:Uma2 family endonuclease [Bacillaceae bacterium Marseille-Q3522]
MSIPDRSKHEMTYKEYLTWGDKRCEVLDGRIISMAPSPLPEHQSVSTQLSIEIGSYLRGKRCQIFSAPIDVYLFDNSKNWVDDTVKNWVIPDIIVVCDSSKIMKNGISGAPDLVVEIISPSTAKIDRMDKRLAYQRAGVKEYWIIDPYNKTLETYLLKKKVLELTSVYNKEDTVFVHILEGLKIG